MGRRARASAAILASFPAAVLLLAALAAAPAVLAGDPCFHGCIPGGLVREAISERP